jgi:serine/threonine protein kinase
MEMLQGEPLSERITRLERVPPDELFRFLGEVLRAMGKAHEAGIVHRDLKPDNIFIVRDEPEFAKILDFGVAKIQNGAMPMMPGGVTQTGMMIGTPYYMSPEQSQAKEVDHRTDLWAIAVIAFEALLGRRPFFGESFGELVIEICTTPIPIPSRFGSVPVGFDEWFVRATQRDRQRRFQSAREMAEELASLGAPAGQRVTHVTGPMRAMTPLVVPQNIPMPRAESLSPLPRVESVAPVPRESLSPRPEPSAPFQLDGDRLELTTGQRSVLSRSGASRSRGVSPALMLLLGTAALIVVGVIAFVAGGGARAFRERGASEPNAAVAANPQPPAAAPTLAADPTAPAPSAAAASALSPAGSSLSPLSGRPGSARPPASAPAVPAQPGEEP